MTDIDAVASVDYLTAADVRHVIDAATGHDGVAPISEQQLLHMSSSTVGVVHLIARDGASIAGYAVVDRSDPANLEAELVVSPSARRHGVGSRLVEQIRIQAGRAKSVNIWAHGNLDGAAKFAASTGMTAERTLWQLRRPAAPPVPAIQIPDGVTIRAFRDSDSAGWVQLNATAFAHHPEQGSWTIDDLRVRQAEPWFDPAGFLIAEASGLAGVPDGTMLGFHWTKIHGPSTAELAADPALAADAIGEVYVVGVSPKSQGIGLGRVLTNAGLAHLIGKGLPQIMLYVDDDNTAAMNLYASLGFAKFHGDVQYRLALR